MSTNCLWAGLDSISSVGVFLRAKIARYGSFPVSPALRIDFFADFTADSTFLSGAAYTVFETPILQSFQISQRQSRIPFLAKLPFFVAHQHFFLLSGLISSTCLALTYELLHLCTHPRPKHTSLWSPQAAIYTNM